MTRGLQNPRKKLGTKATQAVDVSGFELFEPATSSNVKRVRYDAANERLHVEFRTGSYRYEGVPRAMFDELTKAESAGAFIVARVRGVYSCDPEPAA